MYNSANPLRARGANQPQTKRWLHQAPAKATTTATTATTGAATTEIRAEATEADVTTTAEDETEEGKAGAEVHDIPPIPRFQNLVADQPADDHRDRNHGPRSRSPNRSDRRDTERQRSPHRGSNNPRGPNTRDRDTRPDHRNGDRERRPPPSQPSQPSSRTAPAGPRLNAPPRPAVVPSTEKADVEMEVDEGDDDEDPEERAMRKMMGFKNFKTTKNTKVPGNDRLYAVRKDKVTQYRQYMNRVGGFNRPLSPSQM